MKRRILMFARVMVVDRDWGVGKMSIGSFLG
jgi:hypothetical protein